MSDSVRPQRRQPTRPLRPWDSPGKNTGVGCHFLLQCMKVKSESEVAQSCPTLSDPMDWSLPGSSVHGIFQARVLEWGCHRLLRILLTEAQNNKAHLEIELKAKARALWKMLSVVTRGGAGRCSSHCSGCAASIGLAAKHMLSMSSPSCPNARLPG